MWCQGTKVQIHKIQQSHPAGLLSLNARVIYFKIDLFEQNLT